MAVLDPDARELLRTIALLEMKSQPVAAAAQSRDKFSPDLVLKEIDIVIARQDHQAMAGARPADFSSRLEDRPMGADNSLELLDRLLLGEAQRNAVRGRRFELLRLPRLGLGEIEKIAVDHERRRLRARRNVPQERGEATFELGIAIVERAGTDMNVADDYEPHVLFPPRFSPEIYPCMTRKATCRFFAEAPAGLPAEGWTGGCTTGAVRCEAV
jgi:hypothetical protein